MTEMGERRCPICEGRGCEECDQTGKRHRETWRTADGMTISASGSGDFDPETREALEAVARAAFDRVDPSRGGGTDG